MGDRCRQPVHKLLSKTIILFTHLSFFLKKSKALLMGYFPGMPVFGHLLRRGNCALIACMAAGFGEAAGGKLG
jgi:hypothetical protein